MVSKTRQGSQHVYYYGDPPFIIRAEKRKQALEALVKFQETLSDVSEQYRIHAGMKFSEALSILRFKVIEDGNEDIYFKELDRFNAVGGLGEKEKHSHCATLFKVLAPFGEGVFSFVKRDNNSYTKHRYTNGEYYSIGMDVAIYDSEDKESVAKMTEKLIQLSVELGVSEKDLRSWIESAVVDYVMLA